MARKPRVEQNEGAPLAPVTTGESVGQAAAEKNLPPLVTRPEDEPPLPMAETESAAPEQPAVPDVPAPKRRTYVVDAGGMFMCRGARVMLREGKVIDSLNYDVAMLFEQGLRAHEV